jgi:tetratricopeptide (TPR) repeat protein
MAEMPLVGRARQRLVDELLATFDEVCETKRPRLVTLEADSGAGKTRLMRELYGRLARERQDEPAFWPLNLERPNDADEDVDARRKHISPGRVLAASDVRPTFCWLGVSITDLHYERPLRAFTVDRGQATTFAEVVARRLPARSTPRRRAEELLDRTRATAGLASVAVSEGIATAATLGEFVVPGASIAQWGVQRYYAKSRERRRIDQDAQDADEGPVADHLDRFIEEMVPLLADVGEHVPVVVAVEDAHLASATIVDVLSSILRASSGSVLVIATTWPGRLDDPQREASRLLREVEEDRVVRHRGDAIAVLSLEDRLTLVRGLLEEQRVQLTRTGPDGAPIAPPPVDDRGCRALAERYRTTPLSLEQVCGLNNVRLLIERGRLDEDAVVSLPEDDPAAIYASMWEDLDDRVRMVLELSVLSSPAAISPDLTSGVWDVGIVLDAGRRSGLLTNEVGPEVLRRISEFGWARPVGATLWSFFEPPQYAVASAKAREDIPETLVEEFHAALVEGLRRTAVESADFRDALIIGLTLAGALRWEDDGLAPLTAVDRLLAKVGGADEMGRLMEARAVGQAALPVGLASDPRSIARAVAVAELTGRCGNALAAAERLAAVIPLLESDHGTLLDDVALRHAFWLGEAGRLEDAMSELRAVIDRCERIEPHPSQLTEARVALAAWLGDEARPLEAVALLEAVLDDPSGPSGDLYDEVAVEQQLAYWLGESGATAEALTRLEAIEERLAGRPDPAWLVLQSVRQQRGHWLGVRGASAQAETLLADLEQDRRDRIGPGHPDTLSTRNQRWSWAARRGAVHEGVTEYRRLARDRLRVLGPDAPPTYGTQNNLAILLVEAGEYTEAAGLLDDVARQMSVRFTPTHRSAILARANAANLAGIRGDAESALDGLRAAHADWCTRHLTGTRDELALRGNIGVWLDGTGATAEALSVLEATLAEQQARLDTDDPDTLITAVNVAFLRDRQEGHGPVRTRPAADDLEQVLGPVAPEVLTAWHDVGHLLLDAGAVEDARHVLTDVLERRTQLLGAEHPDTRVTADELAFAAEREAESRRRISRDVVDPA